MITRILDRIKAMTGTEVEDSRSPAGNWLKPRLEAAERGKVTLSVLVRPEMCNPYGNIHGGMMSLVADEAIGWAVVSLEAEAHYTSVSLHLDFLFAAAQGERVVAVAEIIRQGKKIINASVEIFNEKGILLSRATSNLVVTGMKIKEN